VSERSRAIDRRDGGHDLPVGRKIGQAQPRRRVFAGAFEQVERAALQSRRPGRLRAGDCKQSDRHRQHLVKRARTPCGGAFFASASCALVMFDFIGALLLRRYDPSAGWEKTPTFALRLGSASALESFSPGGVLRCPRRMGGVELPIALLDAARTLVPGNHEPDVIRASPFARRGDFPLRLPGCQGKDPIAEGGRGAPTLSGS
jgi:hypothetical protein